MNIQEALTKITNMQDLSSDEMLAIMRQIMTGQLTQSQIGGFLMALRTKNESIEEITAGAMVMRELVTRVRVNLPNVIDVVGTGGDGKSSFNVSTTSAFVAVAAGAYVAKHGNRAMSGKCGSADLLEHAGARTDLTPEQVAACVEESGFGFMFAPAHHSAMKHAIGVRVELGVRTIFNILGPLTNPALVRRKMVGVFSEELVKPFAHVLKNLGAEHVVIVHSEDGMDEISISAPTHCAELKDGVVTTYMVRPEDFGMSSAAMENIVVNNPEGSLAMVRSVLKGESSVASDMTALNAGAAIYVAGQAEDFAAGVECAQNTIRSGAANAKFDEFIETTNRV